MSQEADSDFLGPQGIAVPNHVGIIPDGNRRWAKTRGVPLLFAYRKGAEQLETIMNALYDAGVKYLTVYGFSLKNFERSEDEKKNFFSVMKTYLPKVRKLAHERRLRVSFAGRTERFSEELRRDIAELSRETAGHDQGGLVILAGYYVSDDLEQASARLKENGSSLRECTFVPPDVPPIDLLIRTSGEQRLSGFPTYLMGETEFYFPLALWPDFDKAELEKALAWYAKRDKRFGR